MIRKIRRVLKYFPDLLFRKARDDSIATTSGSGPTNDGEQEMVRLKNAICAGATTIYGAWVAQCPSADCYFLAKPFFARHLSLEYPEYLDTSIPGIGPWHALRGCRSAGIFSNMKQHTPN